MKYSKENPLVITRAEIELWERQKVNPKIMHDVEILIKLGIILIQE